MKNRFLYLIFILIALPSMIFAQCNQYQTQMVESVSAIYETSNSIFEAKVELNRVLDNFKAGETAQSYDELNNYVKLMRENVGATESILEIALSNADMCYCLNGQIQADELLVEIDKLNESSKQAIKLIKSLNKTTEPKVIEKTLTELDTLLYDAYDICEKASEKARNAQNICY
jgi:hypothetical protein